MFLDLKLKKLVKKMIFFSLKMLYVENSEFENNTHQLINYLLLIKIVLDTFLTNKM